MKIAIIGAGRVGRALGTRWAAVGHDVVYGVRDVSSPKIADLPRVATVSDAVRGVDVVLVSLPWAAVREAVSGLPVGNAVVIDATNPLAANAPETAANPTLSGAELVRDWIGSTHVVKAFNTTGSANMSDSSYPAGRIVMPVAGDDADAKSVTISLANEIGFDGLDTGPLASARDLEHLAMIWIHLAYPLGNGPNIAFNLMRR